MIRINVPMDEFSPNLESEDIKIIKYQINNAEKLVQKEYEKGINTWDNCVRTVLSIIQGHSQMATYIIGGESVGKIEEKVLEINKNLESIINKNIIYPNEPNDSEKGVIFSAIKELKPLLGEAS